MEFSVGEFQLCIFWSIRLCIILIHMIKEDCICELILLSKHVPFIGRVKYMDLFPQGSQATQHWAEAKEMDYPPLPNVSKRDKAYCGQSKDCVIGHGAAFFHYEAFALLCSWEAFLLLCFGGCCVLVQMKPATGPVEVLLPEVWDRVRGLYGFVLLLLWYTGYFRHSGEKCGFHAWNNSSGVGYMMMRCCVYRSTLQ